MSALENLRPDQRAVLQLVLQRGHSYDQIAQLLSIDRSAVRQRALDAFDALTPSTVLPGSERALITDYLLGQLPERVAEQVYTYLVASEADRAWAEAMVEVIGPLVSHSLPEVPAGGASGIDPAADPAAGGLERGSDDVRAHAPTAQEAEDELAAPAWGYRSEAAGQEPAAARQESAAGRQESAASRQESAAGTQDARDTRPVSRRGGAILLSIIGILIAAAIVVAVVTSGSSGGGKPATGQTGGGSRVTSTSTTHTSSDTGTVTTTTGTTPTTPQILAQLNLTSPSGAGSTLGIVQVVREGGVVGIVIDAQGVPANTSHNAYAVWLYNSPSSHRFVGFVPTLVGKNGKLTTEGTLPAGAASYHRLLVTLETHSKPTSPGEVVLSGPFREHP